jgi:hypothetical protein
MSSERIHTTQSSTCRLFSVLLAVMFLLVQHASAGPISSKFRIHISGIDGERFTGSISSVTISGKAKSESVEGTMPAEYIVEGQLVSVAIQKQSQRGTLKVEILKERFIRSGLKTVASGTSSAAYGVVSLSAN